MKCFLPGLWVTLCLSACGGGELQARTLTPTPDSLKYSASPSEYSGTDRFTWSVTAQEAEVGFDGTALTDGSVHATILDNDGQVILDQTLNTQPLVSAMATKQGQAGVWQIRLDYHGATGTFAMVATVSTPI